MEAVQDPKQWSHETIELYQTHFDKMVTLARRYLDETGQAEEVTQDAFIRLHQAKTRNTIENEIGYLRSTVLNLSKSVLRRRQCGERRVAELPIPVDTPTDEIAGRSERRQRVRSACSRLSQQQRKVIEMRYWGDLSEAEIATVMGISAGAVKTHAHRARLSLRSDLQPLAS